MPDRRSTARLAALAALLAAAAVTIVVLVARSGGEGRTYTFVFQNSGRVVPGYAVNIGAARVGTVEKVGLTTGDDVAVTVRMDDGTAPLRHGTTAAIRALSLTAIRRYVAINPGPNSSPPLADGATVGVAQTTSMVELDQLLNMFDARTRRATSRVTQGSAESLDGRTEEASRTLLYLNPALTTSSTVFEQLADDDRSFGRLVAETSRLVTSLEASEADVVGAVDNSATVTGVLASSGSALDATLRELPVTLDRGEQTLAGLRQTLPALRRMTTAADAGTPRLPTLLTRLRALLGGGRPTWRDLAGLLSQPGAANDLGDLLNGLPALVPRARRGLRALGKAAVDGKPSIDFMRPYTPDLVGALRNVGEAASGYDANGHYVRISPQFNVADISNGDPPVITPVPAEQRRVGTQVGVIERCPGSVVQPPVDGSAPFGFSLGGRAACDPALRPAAP